MAVDYLPQSDPEFVAWVQNFVTYANANLAALGLVAGDMTPVTNAQTAFNTAFNANVAAQNAAQNARQAKDDARTTLETVLRALARRLQAAPVVTNAQRQSLGLSVRDRQPTAARQVATRPIASVDTSQRLRHTVSFMDEATPTSKAKPDGVLGCEVWVKVGGLPPTDPGECTFLALDTRTPYTAEFDGADAGKTAHYMLRWVNTRGDKGPWSETASATITG